MSSSAYVKLEPDTKPIAVADWLAFCEEQELVYSPQTSGRNCFYRGEVEVTFGESVWDELPKTPAGRLDFAKAHPPESAQRVTVSTYSFGSAMPEVARLAGLIWQRWGGSLDASPEIREHMFPGSSDECGEDVAAGAPQGPRVRPSALAERLEAQ